MATIKVKANETFSTGTVSMWEGEVRTVDESDETFTALLSEEYVEEYTEPIVPTGTISITANGTDIDVSQYALANVAVE